MRHKHDFTIKRIGGVKESYCECGMSKTYYEFAKVRFLQPKKIVCPCTKQVCPLHDQSSGGRDWCDNNGDPSGYERCPIPKKRKEHKE
jgi:hypothetical protein